MKQFYLEFKHRHEVEDLYDWCRNNIGTENVLWWDADHTALYNGKSNIWIEDDDYETIFVLRWSQFILTSKDNLL